MKNSKAKNAILTGIFILAGIAILLAGVFIIGGKDKTFRKTVQANAIFDDVNGLAKGNNVWYAGVKIGIVKQVKFIEHGVEVTFSIEEDVRSKIRRDTKVKLATDGLIGNKILVLYGGTETSPEIESGDILKVENGLSTDAMMATLQENNKNLLQITSDFKDISKGIAAGNGTIGKLLKDETISNSLQSTMATLNRAGANAQTVTANFSALTAKLNGPGLLNDLATDTTIINSLQSTVAQLHQVSVTANSIVDNLNNTTASLNNQKGTAGMLLHDEAAANNIRNTLVNLQSGTRKLDENMEALQHNIFFRGFFKKKAKAEEKNRKDSLEQLGIKE